MAENTAIEWCHSTFNPWWGCVKVSAGCEHCYAETLSKRTGHSIWGPAKTTVRRLFGDKHWNEPLKWNQRAGEAGERHRVFCASMADVFEDHPQVVDSRHRLFELIDRTPHLDWLLLTKRPENIRHLWPFGYYDEQFTWPNVWLGTSVESQEMADKRIPELLKIPAAIRFLSCEPLLGPIDFRKVPGFNRIGLDLRGWWVIVGGESGPKARPMHPDWARSLRDQCQTAGVAYFFKQWGEYRPFDEKQDPALHMDSPTAHLAKMHWEFDMYRVGKQAAGRLLDGKEWSEFPVSAVGA